MDNMYVSCRWNLRGRAWCGYACVGIVVLIGILLFSSSAKAEQIYGVSGLRLVTFDSQNPSVLLGDVTITGIAPGQTIEGLDVRPLTGLLYALGYDQSNGLAQLYIINPMTGAATAVDSNFITLQPNMGKIGFAFDPVSGRIRITGSNTNVNYRADANGDTLISELPLKYKTGDPNFGLDPSVGTISYTNSFVGAGSTTMMAFDDSVCLLLSADSVGNGNLRTIGFSGFFVNLGEPSTDMDIGFDSVTNTNIIYISANTYSDLSDSLYELNPANGNATNRGRIGSGISIKDIAVAINRTIPPLSGRLVYGITLNNNLISFDSKRPQIIRNIKPITGMAPGQQIVGSDFRPATGGHYLLGYNPVTSQMQVYTLSDSLGIANAVAISPITVQGNADKMPFDFDPVKDQICVTDRNNGVFYLDPNNGQIISQSGPVKFASGDPNAGKNLSFGAIAFTNNYFGASSTKFLVYDNALNVVVLGDSLSDTIVHTPSNVSGITVSTTDRTHDLDAVLDTLTDDDIRYFAANTGTSTSDNFYTINPQTGQVTIVGRIGTATPVRDIAIALPPPRRPTLPKSDLVWGLVQNTVIYYNPMDPNAISIDSVTGIAPGQKLNSIYYNFDIRQFSGVGYNNQNGQMQLYKLDSVGKVTPTNAPVTLQPGMGRVSAALNPFNSILRVTGSAGGNYRFAPDGTIIAEDPYPRYAPGDPNAGKNIEVKSFSYGIVSVGAGPLYRIGEDAYTEYSGQNSRLLENGGIVSTGPLTGITTNPSNPIARFTIVIDTPSKNTYYIAANTPASTFSSSFVAGPGGGPPVNYGRIGTASRVESIAKRTATTLKTLDRIGYVAADSERLYSVSSQYLLFRNVSPSNPVKDYSPNINRTLPLDYRPATGQLYGLGYVPATGEGKLFRIVDSTGADTLISLPPMPMQPNMGKIGMDFNPTTDRIRVVGSNGANFRINPNTGTIVARDSNLHFAPGDPNFGRTPRIGSITHTNNYNGATATSVLAFDDSLRAFFTIDPPNEGTLHTLPFRFDSTFGTVTSFRFDTYYNHLTGRNEIYAMARPAGAKGDSLYSLDFDSLKVISYGQIGYKTNFLQFTVRIDSVVPGGASVERTALPGLLPQPIVSPNPTSGEAMLQFNVRRHAWVRVTVIDGVGREVRMLHNGHLPPGTYRSQWNTENLPAGTYLVRVEADGELHGWTRMVVQ